MKPFLSILLSSVFITLSILHLYWVFGGKKGLNKALPTEKDGKRVLNPKKHEILMVSIGLLVFSFYYFLKTEILTIELPKFVSEYSGWIISIIFCIRAIGDFKYVGFFKKVKNTEFGKFDTKYFSYISLLIGVIGVLLQIL